MKKLFSFFALLLVVLSAFAQPTDTATGRKSQPPLDIEAERRRIQAERAREEARYQTEEAACYAKFAVTDCIRHVRVYRREALDKLRRQALALNDAERKRKALEQIERIQEKSSAQRMEEEAARRLEAREAQQEREERATQKAAASMKAKSGQVDGERAQKSVEQGRTAADVAKDQQQYNDKLKEAQEHRASREKSNKEKSRAPTKPLSESP